MTDLSDGPGFQMGDSPPGLKPEVQFVRAQNRVIQICDDIYGNENGSRTKLEKAEMHVYVCKCVQDRLERQEYWKAITDAIIDLLALYPLRGS